MNTKRRWLLATVMIAAITMLTNMEAAKNADVETAILNGVTLYAIVPAISQDFAGVEMDDVIAPTAITTEEPVTVAAKETFALAAVPIVLETANTDALSAAFAANTMDLKITTPATHVFVDTVAVETTGTHTYTIAEEVPSGSDAVVTTKRVEIAAAYARAEQHAVHTVNMAKMNLVANDGNTAYVKTFMGTADFKGAPVCVPDGTNVLFVIETANAPRKTNTEDTGNLDIVAGANAPPRTIEGNSTTMKKMELQV